jgi:Anti-sigma-K factor rskA
MEKNMPTILTEDEQLLAAGYVLGDLDAAELAEFEVALANNQDLQTEVSALQIAYLQSAFGKTPQGLALSDPPSNLKAQIIGAFVTETIPVAAAKAKTITTAITKPVAESAEVIAPVTTPIARKPLPWAKILAGIGVLFGGFLVFDNFTLRQQLQFAEKVNQQDLANVLNQPNSRLVSLNSQENKVVGNILFTPGNWQQVIVSAKDLPPLPADQVYRMWLELVNGQVIPCGEFKTNAQGAVFVKLNAKEAPPTGVKAKGVYITIEQPNAPLQPTGQKIIEGTI